MREQIYKGMDKKEHKLFTNFLQKRGRVAQVEKETLHSFEIWKRLYLLWINSGQKNTKRNLSGDMNVLLNILLDDYAVRVICDTNKEWFVENSEKFKEEIKRRL